MAASVAWQPPAAATTSMMARLDRLDLLLGYLEEMHRNTSASPTTAASSQASTPTAGDGASSAASTPRGSWRWRRAASSCRPAKEVLEEAQAKGSLVDRIAFLEHRLLKMEDDMEITPEKTSQLRTIMGGHDARKEKVHHPSNKKKGLKSLVKSCVRGNLNTKDYNCL